MFGFIKRKRNRKKYRSHDIDPDEIFLDSANLMNFDRDQFEGRLEKPIAKRTIAIAYLSFLLIFSGLLYKVFMLQIVNGQENWSFTENNRLKENVIFATRGTIYDRNGTPLAWNEPQAEGEDFAKRVYTDKEGISGMLGFITYPKKDSKGFYYELNYKGKGGIEEQFESVLAGVNGSRIVETNALGEEVSKNLINNPDPGDPITLSIDADVQQALYQSIRDIAEQVGFQGGGGIIMDVNTGEILALASYPEINSQKLADADPEYIKELNNSTQKPFLNRVTQGLYTPGSIVKPIVAIGGLTEGTINENTVIYSGGKLEVPNPYDPSKPSYFSDWKAHGSVDVRDAIAVSSNIFFYEVGGGWGSVPGLGITRLEKYYRMFGYGSPVTGQVSSRLAGTIPNPEWKEKNFDGDIWRLGDTYFTSIGQYGFQVTPLQVVRAVAAVANKGTLYNPLIIKDTPPDVANTIDSVSDRTFNIIHEGMRQGAVSGTGAGLNMEAVHIATKTGTAELGVTKGNVNSWTTGFFPYENPRYAFAIVMERGKKGNLIGGVAVSRKFFDWMAIYKPEYLK